MIYRARHVHSDRLVALKMLLAGQLTSDEIAQRFRQEAEAGASLAHPNIVSIYEAGEDEGQPYFSMQLVKGISLARLMRKRALSPRRAARYLESIAEAIAYAHENGILHGDLKPGNILIDVYDRAHVIEFGPASRLFSNGNASTGPIDGSPAYMAPEQIEPARGRLGPATDIYALGAMFYRMLCGRAPFTGGSARGKLAQILHGELVAPRVVQPGVPEELETICLKCLHKEPRHRYRSARLLAKDLAAWLEG